MGITKDENNLWRADFYCKDLQGNRVRMRKGNFKTKKEAQAWMDSCKAMQANTLNMSFSDLYEIYRADMSQRLRENTMKTKTNIVELKILPFFGKIKITDITPAHIRQWQMQVMKQEFSQTYLKMIHNQLSAIFNYAVRYYDLPSNPCTKAGPMGKGVAKEMQFWEQKEFEAFAATIKDKEFSYNAFVTLYWTGLRLGELLALTISDYDPKNKTISVTKSLQRIDGKDIITEPKTPKSKRVIILPDFLVDQLNSYLNRLYGMMPWDKLFPVTKNLLEKELKRGIKLSGVKPIRIHDLRHSHASLLISKLGAQPKLVADRLGHENIQTTLSIYSHLYPNQARSLAESLDRLNDTEANEKENKNKEDNSDE